MYLNNFSNSQITINLSAKRVIEPYSSLHLNDKDVTIIKDMIAKRHSSKSLFEDVLRMSKIRIEDDSRYAELIEKGKKIAEEDEAVLNEIRESKELEAQQEDAQTQQLTEASSIPTAPNELQQQEEHTAEALVEEPADAETNAADDTVEEETDNTVEEKSDETADADEEKIDEKASILSEVQLIVDGEGDDIKKIAALTDLAQSNGVVLKNATKIKQIVKQINEAFAE